MLPDSNSADAHKLIEDCFGTSVIEDLSAKTLIDFWFRTWHLDERKIVRVPVSGVEFVAIVRELVVPGIALNNPWRVGEHSPWLITLEVDLVTEQNFRAVFVSSVSYNPMLVLEALQREGFDCLAVTKKMRDPKCDRFDSCTIARNS